MNDEQGLPGSDSELGGRDEKRRPQQACPLSFLVRVFSFYIFDWFGFTINLMFLAVPKLLYNRLHCLSVGRHYLHDLTVNCKAILETCDPWDMWSKWQPDLTNQPTYLHANLHTNTPTRLPTYIFTYHREQPQEAILEPNVIKVMWRHDLNILESTVHKKIL